MNVVSEDVLLLEACEEHRTQIDGDELLAAFAEVMREWGHYRTAKGMRYPTAAEARQAAAGRRTDRGWDTTPLP
jgi:hypothetical protein